MIKEQNQSIDNQSVEHFKTNNNHREIFKIIVDLEYRVINLLLELAHQTMIRLHRLVFTMSKNRHY